jgi:pimeloyl-ACP methyl ester carboxylesterase
MPHLSVGDIQLYYEVAGQGEPLLLLHGLGGSSQDWPDQVPAFAERYRVITADMRGHGRSDKPVQRYSVPLFAADTRRLLDGLGVTSAHVLGLSMGGMIAFQLAADHPEMVRSLIIANSGPELVPRTLKEHLIVWQRFAIVRLMGMAKMGQVLAPRLFPGEEQEGLRRLFAERWAQNDKRAYLASTRALLGWSVADRLAQMNRPTLVVASDQDYTPVAAKEAYVAKMPNARLAVIKNARHAVTLERPAEFNAAVLDFLAQHEGQPASQPQIGKAA